MSYFGFRPWFYKQLEPLAQSLRDVPSDAFTWTALASSIGAGILLYFAYDKPALAVAAVPLLAGRVFLNALDELICQQRLPPPASVAVKELSDRLADVAIFLGVAFWPDSRLHLALLALIAVLIVSHAGVLGKAYGRERIQEGILGKSERMVLFIVACFTYGIAPDLRIAEFSVFESLFALFIPLASLTLLQRLDILMRPLDDR